MANSPEISLFLTSFLKPATVTGEKFPDEPGFIADSAAWKELFLLAGARGGSVATVLLAYVLDRTPWKSRLPADILAVIDEKILRQKLKLAIAHREIDWILQHLALARIPAVFTGAIDLSSRFFPDASARPLDLITILVPPDWALETLRALGKGDYRERAGESGNCLSRGPGAPPVSIRQRIFPRDSEKETEMVFQRRALASLPSSAKRIPVLSASDCLVDLLANDQGSANLENSVWLNDLHFVIRSPEVNWELVQRELDSRGLLRSADSILDFLSGSWGTELPVPVRKENRNWVRKRGLFFRRQPLAQTEL